LRKIGGKIGGKHSLYVDKFTQLFYLLIQLVRTANYGRWWLQSDPSKFIQNWDCI